MKLHWDALPEPTYLLLKELISNHSELLEPFVLVGGTNLALRIGHRLSIDLDYFCITDIDFEAFYEKLLIYFPDAVLNNLNKGGLQVEINNVRCDFVKHRYPYLAEPEQIEGVRLSSFPDVCAMKLNAIMNRGAKKDFWDIYFILQEKSLQEIIEFYSSKYLGNYISAAFLRSLTYFHDAEDDPDPQPIIPLLWEDVKKELRKKVLSIETKNGDH